MKFKTLLLPALAICVSSFQIPEGQPDGIYSVHLNSEGIEVHTLLEANQIIRDDYQNTTNSAGGLVHSFRFRRQVEPQHFFNELKCTEYLLPEEEIKASEADLDSLCGGGTRVGAHKDFYAVRGCTISYFCNYSWDWKYWKLHAVPLWPFWKWQADYCFKDRRQQASDAINIACGKNGAGYDYYWAYNKATWGSYGRENVCAKGRDFCGYKHALELDGTFDNRLAHNSD